MITMEVEEQDTVIQYNQSQVEFAEYVRRNLKLLDESKTKNILNCNDVFSIS